MKSQHDYISWIHKQLTGQVSPAETSALQQWLQQDPQHQQIMDALATAWRQAGYPHVLIDPARKAQQRKRLLNRYYAQRQARRRKAHHLAAALVLLVCSLAILVTAMLTPVVVTATRTQHVWLTDSTHIILQPKATLEVTWSPDQLNASFEGEALFDCTNGRPAHLVLREGTVDAEDASFLIRSGRHQLYILVLSGKVLLTVNRRQHIVSPNKPLSLTPNG